MKKELQSNLPFPILVIKYALEGELKTTAKGMKSCVIGPICTNKTSGVNIITHDHCVGIKVSIEA